MLYAIILISSAPLLLWLLTVKNIKNNPIYYFYYLGCYIFLILGSFYSLDGANRYIRMDVETNYYVVVILAIVCSFYISVPILRNSRLSLSGSAFSAKKVLFIFYFLLIFHVLYVFVYLLNNNVFSYLIMSVSSGGGSDLVSLRTGMFEGGGGLTTYVFYNMTYYICGLLMLSGINRTKRNVLLFYFFFCTIVFLHKTPIIILIITMFLSNALSSEKVTYGKTLRLGGLVTFSILVFYVFYFPDRPMDFYLIDLPDSIFHRISGVYSETLAYSIYRVESMQGGLLLGSSFPNPLGIFPHTPIYLPRILHTEMMGFPGNMSAPAIAEIYLNFGLLACLMFIFSVPFLIMLVEKYFSELKVNSVLKTSLVIYVSVMVVSMSQSSLFGTLLEPKNVIIFAMILIYIRLKR
ncbi:hypothetical protein CWN82_11320 [Vibrio splendidus]|nr:hypothetical protein CWN82_11320 [Vibrio splendidus]